MSCGPPFLPQSTRVPTRQSKEGGSGGRSNGTSGNGSHITDHRFTGQKLDGTGLMYYQGRYYDPAVGTFISPDTLVPDAGSVFDYNRFMYVRGRVLNANDPSGHTGISVVFDGGKYPENYQPTAYPANLNDTGLSQSEYTLAQSIYSSYVSNNAAYDADFAASLQGNQNASTKLAYAQAYVEYFADTEFKRLSYAVLQEPLRVVVADALAVGGDPESLGSFSTLGIISVSTKMTLEQQALKELVDEASLGGRRALKVSEAETVLDWAYEVNYPGWRAGSGDVTQPSNWSGRPGYPNESHIHIPGVGSGHIPVEPGVGPR